MQIFKSALECPTDINLSQNLSDFLRKLDFFYKMSGKVKNYYMKAVKIKTLIVYVHETKQDRFEDD